MVVIQNVPHEGPGRIIPVFRDFGIPVQVRRMWAGDELPAESPELRVLIVLGGPMGVGDIGGGKYPYLQSLYELIQKRVQADRAVLGICLGAQLIAAAGGAKVYPNTQPGPDGQPIPAPEIGWGPVSFPFPGGTEPIVFGLSDGSPMFHWHFDTFDLPKLPPPEGPPKPGPPPPTGNALLSSTGTCRNQAFRFKTRLFGFQYHFELARDDFDRFLDGNRQQAIEVLGPDGPSRIRDDTEKHYARYERLGNRLLTNYVQFLKAYTW
jgi:GMP synthase-like glutamine amidotransferase